MKNSVVLSLIYGKNINIQRFSFNFLVELSGYLSLSVPGIRVTYANTNTNANIKRIFRPKYFRRILREYFHFLEYRIRTQYVYVYSCSLVFLWRL